jgi:hypothetical protein
MRLHSQPGSTPPSAGTDALLWGIALVLATSTGLAADQPQWGHAWTRNQVSAETNLPATFDPATGKNVKWRARLGTEAHSTPVIAGGRVYIGTNNNDADRLRTFLLSFGLSWQAMKGQPTSAQ